METTNYDTWALRINEAIRAKKKREKAPKQKPPKAEVFIPLSVLLDRKVSVLEVIVEFLKEKLHLSYHKIAVLTNRNDRTIWTVYNRAKKKRAANK